MRAAILAGVGSPFEIRDDVVLDAPGRGEVRVRLVASGVCHTDLSFQNGTLAHPMPAIFGHEGAGEVVEVGDGVEHLRVGDHVVASWIASCGRCVRCIDGQANLCVGQALDPPQHARVGSERIYTRMATGTFAEETILPVAAAIRIAPDIPLDLAALLGCG